MESRLSLHAPLLFRTPSQVAEETHSKPETFSNHSPHTPPARCKEAGEPRASSRAFLNGSLVRRSSPLCRLPPTDHSSPAAISSLLCELARSWVHSTRRNRELRVLAACKLGSDFHTRAERRKLPRALPSPKRKPSRSSEHPVSWLLPCFSLGSDPKRQKKKILLDFETQRSRSFLRGPRPLPSAAELGSLERRGATASPRELLPGRGPGAAS